MRTRFLLGFAVVAAIAVGSIAIALIVHGRERDNFETGQRSEAVRAAHQAEALAALSVGQLSSAAAFYQAEGHFTQHEFNVVADSLLRPGALTATAFIGSVPRAERARFERTHGYPILERGPLGNLRRARDRAQYFPLIHAAATGLAVQLPVGYDVGSDNLRGSYLLRARDRGKPAATPAMRLPVGGTGINVFRPVYRDGAPTRSVAERRAALLGFAGGAFRVPDLAVAATTALPDRVDAAFVERGKTVSGPELPEDETATAPIRIADRTWLLVVRDPSRPGVDLSVMIALVGLSLAALLAALVLVWSRHERMQELALQASQDPLTGLKNRRRFEEELRAELARSHRYGVAGALLMLDLDHFKQVNDTLGHPAGDRVLAEIAAVLQGRARETDVLARIGGDEFAIVLPRCELDEAEEVGGEITKAIRERMSAEKDVPPITASVGIAAFGSGDRLSYEAVFSRADAALYAAKGSGRDRVQVFDSTTPEPQPGEVKVTAAAPRQPAGAVPEPQDPAGGDDEPSPRRGLAAQPPQQSAPGNRGGPVVGEKQKVSACRGRRQPRRGGPTEVAHRHRLERVGDRDAVEADAAAQLSACDRPGERRRLRREGRVNRRAQHHQLAPGSDEAPIGPLIDGAQRLLRQIDALYGEIGVFDRRAEAGKVLCRGGDTAGLQTLGKGHGRRLHCRRGRTEAAVRFGDRAAGPGDVQDRGQVDVDPELAQAGRGRPPLLATDRRAGNTHPGGGEGRRATDPLHQAALLVNHDQQRVAQSGRPADGLELVDQAPSDVPAGQVRLEEDHPGQPSFADHSPQGPRHSRTREASDEALAGELSKRELRCRAGRRRTAAIAEHSAEGEGRKGQPAASPPRPAACA